MSMLHWWKFKRHLSPYRDHSLPTPKFRALWGHLFHCPECRGELNEMEQLGSALRALPSPAIPKDLSFEIHLRLSQEQMRRERPSLFWRLTTQWGHLAIPGLSGVLASLILFSAFLPSLWPAVTHSQDIPLLLHTPARLLGTGPLEWGTKSEEMVVQILVDPQGRVADYDIVDGRYTPQDVRDLRNRLLFTFFDPATVFGMPKSDTLLISFRSLRIRG